MTCSSLCPRHVQLSIDVPLAGAQQQQDPALFMRLTPSHLESRRVGGRDAGWRVGALQAAGCRLQALFAGLHYFPPRPLTLDLPDSIAGLITLDGKNEACGLRTTSSYYVGAASG